MADNKIEAWLRLRDARRFQSDANQSAAALRRVGDSADHVGRRSAFASKASGAMEGGLNLIGAAASRAAIGVGLMGGAAVGMGLKFDTSMEQNEVAFTHFLGTTDKAKAYLDRLYKLAATTPFEFQDLTTGAKRMMAFGSSADGAYKQLKTIGDAASGLGTGTEGINRMVTALGQMQVAGVVQGDELRQFQEAGINVYKYMIKAGLITKSDIGQIGQMHIDSSKAISAIMTGMQKDFGGMSREQGKTMAGQLSTMKDYASQTFGALAKPLFDVLRSGVLPKINETLQKVAKWARGGGVNRLIGQFKQAGTAFTTAFKFGPESAGGFTGVAGIAAKVGGVVRKVFDGAKDVVTQFLDAIKPAQPFLKNVIIPLFKGLAIGVIASVVGAFKIFIPLLKIFATVLGFVGKLLAPFKGAITGLGIAIGFVAGGPFLKMLGILPKIGGLFRLLGGFVGFTGKMVGKLVGWALRFALAGAKVVIWLVKMSPQFRIVSAVVRGLGSIVARTVSWILGKFNSLVGFVSKLPGRIGRAASGMFNGLKSAFAAAWNFIAGKWNSLSLGFELPGVLKKLPGPDHVSISTPDLPLLARGGVIGAGGSAIVGDAGPELARQQGGKTVVSPLPAYAGASASSRPTLPNALMVGTLRVPVYLDRRKIGESVVEDAADALARS